jgi:2-polyprenyl-3-methyl-5-hydroxy-6-metoxy-1,4-benzoquinol methylase
VNLVEHWDHIYSSEPVQRLGWYETKPGPSLKLLERCGLDAEDPVLDVGAGASTFVDCLLEEGFQHIYAVDISGTALDKLKTRLGEEKANRVSWIVDDVTQPTRLEQLNGIALWHDRALLHFLTEEEHRQTYLRTLVKAVRPGGYVIIAAFSLQGAKKCSGLEVRNYDQNLLAEFLGESFDLKEWFDYLYTMPSGNLRPYIYTLFQKRFVTY